MARWYLAAVMALMGLLQLEGWSVFVDAVESYRFGGWAAPLAAALIAGELVAAVGLAADRRSGAVVALVVSVAWTVLGLQAFGRGLAIDNCGCFGRFLQQELRWWVLVEDLYLLGLAWWVLRPYRTKDPAPSVEGGDRYQNV
jgi:hypothetical protein